MENGFDQKNSDRPTNLGTLPQEDFCIALAPKGETQRNVQTDQRCYYCGGSAKWEEHIMGKSLVHEVYLLCDSHHLLAMHACNDPQIPFPFAPCWSWKSPSTCPRFTTASILDEQRKVVFRKFWRHKCEHLFPLKLQPLITRKSCSFCTNLAVIAAVSNERPEFGVNILALCELHAKMYFGCKNPQNPFFIAPCVLLTDNSQCRFYKKRSTTMSHGQKTELIIKYVSLILGPATQPLKSKQIRKILTTYCPWIRESGRYTTYEQTLPRCKGKEIDFEGKKYKIIGGPEDGLPEGYYWREEIKPF